MDTVIISLLCFVVIFMIVRYIRSIRKDIKHLKQIKAMEQNGDTNPMPRSIEEWEHRAQVSLEQSKRRRDGGTKIE